MKPYHQAMTEARRQYLTQLIEYAHGKVCLAAQVAELNRQYLHKLLRNEQLLEPWAVRSQRWRQYHKGKQGTKSCEQ